MPESQAHGLLRTVREVFVVVSSILIAFGLDAWWGQRSAREDLSRDLSSVGQEMAENADALRYELAFLDRIVAATDTLLAALREDRTGEIVAPDSLVYLATATPSLDLSVGALEAITTTGRLSSVREPRLRLFLAGFREGYADALEEELLARDVYYSMLLPAISSTTDVGAVLRLSRSFHANRRAGAPFPSAIAVAFPSTFEVSNILERRRHLYTVSRDEMAQLLDQIQAHLDELTPP